MTTSADDKRQRLAELLKHRAGGAKTAASSFAQERLWFVDQWNAGEAVGTMAVRVRLTGDLDRSALEESLLAVIRRHEMLRTTFAVREGRLVQVIAETARLDLRVIDEWRDADMARDRTAIADAWTSREARKPFQMEGEPPFRALLVASGTRTHVLLVAVHHLLADAWSMGILVRELGASYEAARVGRRLQLPPPALQYAEYAAWERARVEGGALDAQLAYWRARLDPNAVTRLPTDRARRAVPSARGARHAWTVDAALVEPLRALSRTLGTTLFVTVLSALHVVLRAQTGQDDLVIGTPVSLRHRRELETVFGPLINMLALRSDSGGDPPFRELVRRVQATVIEAFAHQEIPFDRVVDALEPERLGHSPLFQVMFVLQNAPLPTLDLPGLRLEMDAVDTQTTRFDLTLIAAEVEDDLRLTFEYATDLFVPATIQRMAARLEQIFERVTRDPSRPLSELAIPSAEERRTVVETWNDTAKPHGTEVCVHMLFEAQARATPLAVAVVDGARSVTYRELNERANQLAHHLCTLGVGPESLVGVCMDRSLEMIVAIYGIVKAGGAYVPLDPTYPLARIAFIVEESGARVVLTHQAYERRQSRARCADALAAGGARVISIDAEWTTIAHEPAHDLRSGVGPEHVAYVIYTSGSTGRPKGVLSRHRGLVNRLLWKQATMPLAADDAVLQKTPYGFDVSVWELFWPLMVGARLVMAEPEGHRDTAYLVRTMIEQRITTVHFVPSMLAPMVAEPELARCVNLRRVICSGEALSFELAQRFFQRFAGAADVALFNLYGPTEASIDVTWWRCLPDDPRGIVPIGRPIANTRVYVLDGRGAPSPIGVPGELHLGGVGLARGYLHQSELTAERFVPDPFSGELGARLYRTGDLCRWLADGTVEYLGRIDHQVKVRGFRIELGEIESALRQHGAVRDVVVVARAHDGEASAEKRLVAYLVIDRGAALEESAAIAELRSQLEAQVPPYMVPSFFVCLPALPLTPNGKIDRRALPAPGVSRNETGQSVLPRSPAEQAVAAVWAEVLGVDGVDVHADFFELGGHSLHATRVMTRLRLRVGVDLPVRALFEAKTVAALATRVERAWRVEEPSGPAGTAPIARRVAGDDAVTLLSYGQQRLWLLEQVDPDSATYNVPAALRLTGMLDVSALERSLAEIVRRHDALRTTFPTVDGEPRQCVAVQAPLHWTTIDLAGVDAADRELRLSALVQSDARTPFDLARGPLLRATLIRVGEREHALLVTTHHIVSDGWSLGVLMRELAALYEPFSRGLPSPLRDLAIQYTDYSAWQREWLSGGVLDQGLAYWRKQLAGAPSRLDLPTDKARPAIQTYRGATVPIVLPRDLAVSVAALARAQSATMFMTLLGAFHVLLHGYSGQDDVVVGAPIAGRTRPETEGLIGFFVNVVPLRVDLSEQPTVRSLLARVRETTLGAYAHQDVPFEKIVEEIASARDPSRPPIFQVTFSLQNTPVTELALGELKGAIVDIDLAASKFELSLALEETSYGLCGALEYNTDLFDRATAARMVEHYVALVRGFVANPDQRISDLPWMDEAERRRSVVEWNAPVAPPHDFSSVQRLVAARAAEAPDAVAVVAPGESLTYRELLVRADGLARVLREHGVAQESKVAVFLERGADAVVGLLAILRAGGAYVPIDPAYPPDRVAFMLCDASAVAVITDARLRDRLPAQRPPVILVGMTTGTNEAKTLASVDDEDVSPSRLAYVIYTSGSTGTPKGVLVEHGGLASLAAWHRRAYALGPGSRTSQVASLGFDAATWEIWPPLTAGATLVIADDATRASPSRLVAWLADQRIESAFLPTPLAEAVLAEAWPPAIALRTLLTGGDRLRPRPPNRAPFRLVNHYGPTESTVVATAATVTPDGDRAPSIGRPIDGTQVYVLDAALRPRPIGVTGELFIAGAGVARGYAGRPDATAERFLPDPFAGAGARMYRSGDRCRWLDDGTLEYLGRVDQQVKIRGVRVELGEIEATLRGHPEVRDALIVPHRGAAGDLRLAAYVVPRGVEPAPAVLRDWLKKRLPEAMIPSAFVGLAELPLTPHGKIDRAALPSPRAALDAPRTSSAFDAVALDLVRIWEDVLETAPIGVDHDFFSAGGHSLSAVRMMKRVNAHFGYAPALSEFFQRPTVEALAVRIRTRTPAGPWSPLVTIREGGAGRPFFCVHPSLGGVAGYDLLARAVGGDRPFHALRAIGLEERHEPDASVELMAARYVDAVRLVQAHGPYLLGGHSFGGTVAFEMARIFGRAGEHVELVALLDTTPPIPARPRTPDDHLLALAALLHEAGIAEGYHELLGIDPALRIDRCVALLVEAGAIPGGYATESMKRIIAWRTTLVPAMIDRYAPDGYAGAVVVLQATGDLPHVPRAGAADDEAMTGWAAYVAGRIEIHRVPGDHFSMLEAPHVTALGRCLRRCIEAGT